MDIRLFDYQLPESLIASHPPTQRDGGRLMVLDPDSHSIHHERITRMPSLLPPRSLLIANNSRVIPARIHARRPTGGAVEILLVRLEQQNDETCEWTAMCRTRRPLQPGDTLHIDTVVATVIRIEDNGFRRLSMNCSARLFRHLLESVGTVPLPPYIRREAEPTDTERYQTIYAQEEGSVAAPTAGLHLTDTLLHELRRADHDIAFITLHVGPGTFRPISAASVEQHEMDVEHYHISPSVVAAIQDAKACKRPVIAIGTTSVRALEGCAADNNGTLVPGEGSTRIFITPPYSFAIVDGLVTNFHLPRSTLLCLVSAMAGRAFVLHCYEEAIRQQYRFYSYGDAMLIRSMNR